MNNEDKLDSWFYEKAWGGFRHGAAKAKLQWHEGEAVVQIYDGGVEITANAILRVLPIETPVVHVAWSGEMLMGTRTFDIGVKEYEHHVRLVRPGDLAFDPKFGEITVTYGTAEAKLPSGDNTLVVFGQIIDGLDRFAAWARARRFEGVGELALIQYS